MGRLPHRRAHRECHYRFALKTGVPVSTGVVGRAGVFGKTVRADKLFACPIPFRRKTHRRPTENHRIASVCVGARPDASRGT